MYVNGAKQFVSVGLCDDPKEKADAFAHTHGLTDWHKLIAEGLEEHRDHMRLHYPPALAYVYRADNTAATYKAYVGDDTRKIARDGCVALAPAAEVDACTARLGQALDEGLPEELRYSSLCRTHVSAGWI